MRHETQGWEERRAPTLKDVAREVGVSEATASVVLNGARSGTRVSGATRQAVTDAAARIGYRPNSVARALQAGRNHRVGFYSGRSNLDARNLFFAEILGGLCGAALGHGLNVVLHTAGDDPDRLLELVTDASLDGLVLHAGPDDPIIPLLSGLRGPAVFVADPFPGFPSVAVDDRRGGILQAEYLAARGHRHVLYLLARQPVGSAIARMESFLAAAKGLGMRTTVRYEETYARPLDASDFAPALRDLGQGEGDRATAIVAWHDDVAAQTCEALAGLGVAVPGKVAVMGFDGFRSLFPTRFDITSVHAPWFDVGRIALDRLAALGRGEDVPLLTTLPVELIPGSTT